MSANFELDTRSFNRTMREFASITKRGLVDVGMGAAKGFVKRVVAITPPAQGKLAQSKQRGEAAITNDLARIMAPARKSELSSVEATPQELHARFRSDRTGRVNPGRLRRPYPVKPDELRAFRKQLLARVGKLASGWSASAQRLGVALPSWITRHGTARSSCLITLGRGGIAIAMENKVPFAGYVDGLKRRTQAALKYQEGAMRRQINFLLDKAVKKAFR